MRQKAPEANDIYMRTGCTACVLSIDEKNKKLYFANAADSRVVLCVKKMWPTLNKRLINLNQSQKKKNL